MWRRRRPPRSLACDAVALGALQGAVLEPQGVVEIKFRPAELTKTMHRIDPLILKLKVGSQRCWPCGGATCASACRIYRGAVQPSPAASVHACRCVPL